MNDVFSDDFGGEFESAPSTEAVAEAPVIADSTEDVTPEAPAETPEAPVQEASDPEPAAPSDDEIAKLEAEVETALADERTPKWFKNAVENVYKPKLASLSDQLEPLQALGSVEEIGEKLELLNSLNTVRSNPQNGMPELTTEPFVTKVYEENPQVVVQLLQDIAHLPSPYTQGWTLMHEIYKQTGIDPTRLEDIKTFAANGYQLQQSDVPPPDPADLAEIPEHLRATFSALSPERRESLMLEDNENVRNAALEDARIARETERQRATEERTKEERAAQEKAEQEAQFVRTVEAKGEEHFTKSGEAVFTSFVDSLAKQANMTQMEAVMITNTVLNSLEPTLAGRQSLEALKADGITIDPAIPTTLSQMEENAKHIAYYEAVNDRPNMEKAVAKQIELQERVTAKGNKIIAALALKYANSKAASIQSQSSALASTQNNRYATAGVGAQVNGNGNINYDFSDDSYLEDLRSTGFGRR